MTREKAVEASNLLYEIEETEAFKEELEGFLTEKFNIGVDLIESLFKTVDEHLEKLNKKMEEL